jgi:RNA polymerase sigma factor (sigma-70 family)
MSHPEPPAIESPHPKTASSDTERARERFFTLARRQLGALYRFVRHELAYRVEAGDLIEGELTAEDVIDAMLLAAYGEYVRDPSRRRSVGWLILRAQEQIDSEARRLGEARETDAHIEEDAPETPPEEEVTTLGEEILYFYQPDEDLTVEELIPDLGLTTPEQDAQSREQRALVKAALAEMPSTERRALLLRRAEGLSAAQVAEAIGRPRREVERLLEEAQAKVRRRLEEAGYTVPAALETLPRRGPADVAR